MWWARRGDVARSLARAPSRSCLWACSRWGGLQPGDDDGGPTWARIGHNQPPSAGNSCSQPESEGRRHAAFSQVRRRLSQVGGGGQGRGRTADLPLFRRTLVPTELPDRGLPSYWGANASLRS